MDINNSVEDDNPLEYSKEERNFRWAYSLLIELAKICFERDVDSDRVRREESTWSELGNTSKSFYLHEAREMAAISHDEFLQPIRDGEYQVEDLYMAGFDDIIKTDKAK